MPLFDQKSPQEVQAEIRKQGMLEDASRGTGWAAISRAAASGGRQLGQAMGGEDPRIAKAKALQDVQMGMMQEGWEAKVNTPEFFLEAAKRVQPIDPAMAMKMAAEGKKLEMSMEDRSMKLEDRVLNRENLRSQIDTRGAAKPEAKSAKQKDYEYLISIGKDQKEAYKTVYGNKGQTINIDTGGAFKLEPGYMLKDPSDPSKGQTPIPGGSKDKLNAGDAAKAAMVLTAKENVEDIKGLVYNKKGKVDWGNIAQAKVPLVGGTIPFTKGRELGVRMEFGIQAITRLETGAAMPPQEVENTRKRFQPVIGDTEEIVKVKLKMYEDFMSRTIKLIAPDGRFDEQRFQSEYIKRLSTPDEKGNMVSSGGIKYRVKK